MSYSDKIVSLANSEENYHEKKSNYMLDDKYANAGKNNYTKYARDVWSKWQNVLNGNKQGFEWCAVYVLWLFLTVYGDADKALKVLHLPLKSTAAGVPYFYDYMKNAGLIASKPSVGDVIFLNGCKHVGIVKEIKDGKVFTSEGNSNNMVRTVAYKLGDSHIYAYGHPDWNAVPAPVTPTYYATLQLEVLQPYVSTGTTVMQIQRIWKDMGLYTGKIDGDYGKLSVEACKKFQKQSGITADGWCGFDTYDKIFNG